MRCIVTYFIPATNYKPKRVKARSANCSVTLSWKDGIGIEENHKYAVSALLAKLNSDHFLAQYVMAELPGGKGTKVFIYDYSKMDC